MLASIGNLRSRFVDRPTDHRQTQSRTGRQRATVVTTMYVASLTGSQDKTVVVTNHRKPATAPPFTIGSLRRGIPEHCFDRSLLKSGAYLFADLAVVAVLLLGSRYIDLQTFWLRLLLWPVYWFCQVGSHECAIHLLRMLPLPLGLARSLFFAILSNTTTGFVLKAIAVCYPGRRWHWPMGNCS